MLLVYDKMLNSLPRNGFFKLLKNLSISFLSVSPDFLYFKVFNNLYQSV